MDKGGVSLKIKDEEEIFEIADFTKNMTEKIKNMFKLEKEVTFPQIIIDKQNIGGYSDLMKLEQEGQLSKLLE